MKCTFSSLCDFLELENRASSSLEGHLDMLGMELESSASLPCGFIVCKVVSAAKHPKADTLSVCQVDCGMDQLRQIVCGAPNAREGLYTVLALEGAKVPATGLEIKPVSIRGVQSDGMMCSLKELGVPGGDSVGICELDASQWVVGENFFADDIVLDIAITPNRGDLLSVCGIARELASSGLGRLKPFDNVRVDCIGIPTVRVVNTLQDKVTFGYRCFENVKNCESPKWLKQQLIALGVRPQSALVDITNYFAEVFGRPMHVYDASAIVGGEICIEMAKKGDVFKALDGVQYKLDDTMIVVHDASAICSLLGIIGAEHSKCLPNTSSVILEVAWIDPAMVSKARRKLGLNTKSSYVFERSGAQVGEIGKFLDMAANLILEICGGHCSEISLEMSAIDNRKIPLDYTRFVALLGFDPGIDVVKNVFSDLGFVFSEDCMVVPAWRSHNVLNHSDLVEAFIRVYGFDKIEKSDFYLPARPLSELEQCKHKCVEALAKQRGMYEVITWSFMHSQDLLEGCGDPVALLNPISGKLDVMRTSIIPNLLNAAKDNFYSGEKDVAIFELGAIYPDGDEKSILAGLRLGMSAPRNIYGLRHSCDFFDVKADVEAALLAFGFLPLQIKFIREQIPGYYHPGRSAAVYIGDVLVAFCGQLAPKSANFDDIEVMVFEIMEYKLCSIRPAGLQPFRASPYPVVKRDFAFRFDKWVVAQSVIDVVHGLDNELIKDVYIFDRYQMADESLSIAFCVLLSSFQRTLNADDINKVSDNIVSAISSKLSGKLRRDFEQ